MSYVYMKDQQADRGSSWTGETGVQDEINLNWEQKLWGGGIWEGFQEETMAKRSPSRGIVMFVY